MEERAASTVRFSLNEALAELAAREAASLTTVWFALGASIGVYVLAGGMFSDAGEAASISRAQVTLGAIQVSLEAVRWGMVALGLSLLVATAFVARVHLQDDRVVANATGPTDEARIVNGFAYLRKYSFLAWALAEVVILIGTLLAILSSRPLDMFPFVIAGGTSLFLLKPERVSLIALADRMVQPK
jgi:hypothetical protein